MMYLARLTPHRSPARYRWAARHIAPGFAVLASSGACGNMMTAGARRVPAGCSRQLRRCSESWSLIGAGRLAIAGVCQAAVSPMSRRPFRPVSADAQGKRSVIARDGWYSIDLKIATLCRKLRLERASQSPSLPGAQNGCLRFADLDPLPRLQFLPQPGLLLGGSIACEQRQIEITGRGEFGLLSQCEPPSSYSPWRVVEVAWWRRSAEDSPAPANAQPIPTKMPCRGHYAPQRRGGGIHQRAAGTHRST
jgi:hypothetical protein